MGYSCTVKAALTLDAIQATIEATVPGTGSNRLPGGGFWERGREQDDGSITGTIFRCVRRYTDAERAEAAARMGGNVRPEWIGDPCARSGSFKIAADGKIVRFPYLTKAQKLSAEASGMAEYVRRYGRF